MAVKKRQLFLLSGTFKVVPRGAPRGYDDGHLSRLVGVLLPLHGYRNRKKCSNDDDESDQSYCRTGTVPRYVWYRSYIYDGNNCQTAHPTRAPPPTRYRYSIAIRGYINDDESTVLGTDGRFAGSRDTMA